MVGCGQTSATWLPSTMRLPPSTRPSGSRERRSSAFIREDSGIGSEPSNGDTCMADKKTAIVTGASRGIGAGLVEAFLNEGYNVVATSRHITKENPFAAAANVALVDGDIGEPGTAARIVDTAVLRFGRIDVLINNAGVF